MNRVLTYQNDQQHKCHRSSTQSGPERHGKSAKAVAIAMPVDTEGVAPENGETDGGYAVRRFRRNHCLSDESATERSCKRGAAALDNDTEQDEHQRPEGEPQVNDLVSRVEEHYSEYH